MGERENLRIQEEHGDKVDSALRLGESRRGRRRYAVFFRQGRVGVWLLDQKVNSALKLRESATDKKTRK